MRRYAWIALCAAIVSCKSGKLGSGSVHIDPDLEALVPGNTVFLIGANVEAIRETPVYQKLLSRTPLPQLDQFTRQTGLDPRKDLAEILSCSDGKHGLLMARGRFNVPDLEARIAARGVKRFDYKNHHLFGTEQTIVYFKDSSTAVGGTIEEIHALIDRGKGPGLPPELSELIRSIPAKNQIWAALTGGMDAITPNVPPNSNLANIVNALKSVNTATIAMDLSHGVDLDAEASCKTERDAKFVHDIVKGIVGIGRLNTPDNQPDMLKLYDAIQVSQQQTNAKVTATIPPDLADHFLDLWLKR